jgi:murein DD-endopeptidase MepM/ murein hydrolase activator NlpD
MNYQSARKWIYAAVGSIALIAALYSTNRLAGWALGLQLSPSQPRLGDTIVVNISADAGKPIKTAPKIQVGTKTYPSFAVGNKYRAFVPTSPLEQPGQRQVKAQDATATVNVNDRKFPLQRIRLDPGKTGSDATEMELKKVAALKALVTPIKMWTGNFVYPNTSRISSPYGVRRYYNGVFAKDYYHKGMDFAGKVGAIVTAPAPGKVVLVGYEKDGFRVHGNIVGIDHGQGVTSAYLHLSKIEVEEGDMLDTGDTIGRIGGTGAVAGPHLHWGLYVNGISIDPVQWKANSIE